MFYYIFVVSRIYLFLFFRKLLDGVKQFNLDPKAGLEYLVNAGFVQHTPKDVAMFLFRQERLSKKQIGE